MKFALDLSSFNKAIEGLKKSVAYYHSELSNDQELKLQFMAASIQAFEYTYELSVKFLRRYLELTEPSTAVIDEMAFPTLIRTASERNLLKNDWSQWKLYRHARNITSHTYDLKKAESVMAVIPEFMQEAIYLLTAIDNHLQAQ